MEAAKNMVLAEGLFMFVDIISYKWVDGKSTKFSISPFNEFLGGSFTTLIWKKLDLL